MYASLGFNEFLQSIDPYPSKIIHGHWDICVIAQASKIILKDMSKIANKMESGNVSSMECTVQDGA